MRSPLKQPVRSEFLGSYNHRIYLKIILQDDKRNPPPPSSPHLEWGRNRVLTSRWLSPWSSRTSCGRRSGGPSKTQHPCRGSLQRASGPALLWRNTHQRAPSQSANSHKITTLCASWCTSPTQLHLTKPFPDLKSYPKCPSSLGHILSPLWT